LDLLFLLRLGSGSCNILRHKCRTTISTSYNTKVQYFVDLYQHDQITNNLPPSRAGNDTTTTTTTRVTSHHTSFHYKHHSPSATTSYTTTTRSTHPQHRTWLLLARAPLITNTLIHYIHHHYNNSRDSYHQILLRPIAEKLSSIRFICSLRPLLRAIHHSGDDHRTVEFNTLPLRLSSAL
jgi:hypothetical protein